MGRNKKKVLTTIGLVVVAVTAAGLLFSYRTQTTWVESPPYRRVSSAPARTLVVVYSPTGNTLGAAKEVARTFDADMLQIEAPQYARTLKGQRLAAKHADETVESKRSSPASSALGLKRAAAHLSIRSSSGGDGSTGRRRRAR